jgi:hypothetical protein
MEKMIRNRGLGFDRIGRNRKKINNKKESGKITMRMGSMIGRSSE